MLNLHEAIMKIQRIQKTCGYSAFRIRIFISKMHKKGQIESATYQNLLDLVANGHFTTYVFEAIAEEEQKSPITSATFYDQYGNEFTYLKNELTIRNLDVLNKREVRNWTRNEDGSLDIFML